MESTKPILGEVARVKFTSLVELVRHQAVIRPDHPALIFLPDGETEVGRLTYAELDRRARLFAARLQAQDLAGQCVLLMLPSSIYYVVAFLGSLYAKAVPVPVYPPTSSMHAERVAQIVRDCDARGVILASSLQHDSIQAKLSQFFPDGLGCRFLAIDDASAAQEQDWVEPELSGDALAYLQYTSGSTSQPRGVMVTHGNLLAYCQSWQAALRHRPGEVFVNWLPLFHDMGLIGGIILPLFLGATIVLMPPMAFLQKPLRWLAAISRYRGSASFAPNFAYELCAATLDEAQRSALDLSSWAVAANAAEPVHADTLSRFAKRFASCGFRPEAMNPCYGLAEATLSVVQRGRLEAPLVCEVDVQALKRGDLVPAFETITEKRALVGCGRSWLDVKVVVVEPISCRLCAEGEIGEVWIQGATVAAGYWRRPEETAHTFHGRLDNGDGPYLRTGDLGALHQGELFISGRIKDLIIIRGQNHYPQDIEYSVCRAHPALSIGHGAAFSIDIEGEEKLVLVQEIRRSRRKNFDGAEIVQVIAAVIAEQHGLSVHAVLLLNPASVHITSSGKIQRKACRRDFLEDRFEALFAWRDESNAKRLQIDDPAPAAAGADERRQAIAQWLADRISQSRQLPINLIRHDTSFKSFGLDSVQAVALSGELSSWLGTALDPTLMYDHPDIERLARYLAGVENHKAAQPAQAANDSADALPAIVGMACRFPGAASLDAYWRLLENAGNAIIEAPASRWPDGTVAPNKMLTRRGGYIDGVDQFDAGFFGISPREAESMDPQQRLLLQTAWHALEDAGIAADSLAGSKTGVFVGICSNDYRQQQLAHGAGTDSYSGTGNAYSIAANRLSYFLDLRGPSLAIDTACSSSLVALHQACISLRSGECDLAIVGGVNLILTPENTLVFEHAQMMAADGQCKTFDAGADGYVRSEGCGVVVLKRQADALRDGDSIQALLPGSAINQDGRSNGLTAPNGLAQQEVIRQALAAAGITPQQVGYVEAHGTGTSLGDPIEVNALKQAYAAPAAAAEQTMPLRLGAVKANIGHLEAAAGMAGLIKTVLALQHRKIPPQTQLKQLNPLIALEGSRLSIPLEVQSWDAPEERPRFAGVSAFSFGGANAHVIVQEAASTIEEPAANPSRQLLALSAKSTEALRDLAAAYADSFGGTPDRASLAAVCHAANTRRSHHAHRLALTANDAAEMQNLLRRFGQGEDLHEAFTGFAQQALQGKTALLFTGQGAQYAGMARGLYRSHAGFRVILDRCDAILKSLSGEALLARLLSDDAEMDLGQTIHAQPALFALEYALASVWQGYGLRPDYLIGHSLGEYVAACVAGVFSLEDGLLLVTQRGLLMQQMTRPGMMFALHGSAAAIADLLARFEAQTPPDCAIAARNSPEDAVLSGDEAALRRWLARWAEQGGEQDLVMTPLHANRAFHSPLMQTMLDQFAAVAHKVSYALPTLPVISNLSGRIAGAEIATPDYWLRHVLAPVQFADGLRTLSAAGCGVFVEVGPHPVLSVFGQKMLPDALWLHSLRRNQEDDGALLNNLAQWYVHGARVDWRRRAGEQAGQAHCAAPAFALPLYPFRKERHWFTPGVCVQAALIPAPKRPMPGRRIELALDGLVCFETTLPGAADFLREHRVRGRSVMPGAGYISLALSAVMQAQLAPAGGALRLRECRFVRPLDFTDREVRLQTILQQEAGCWRVQISAWSDVAMRWELHANAELVLEHEETAPAEIDDERAAEPQDVARFYQDCFERGLEYGARFQAIRTLERSGKTVRATLAGDCALPASNGLPPALLDAAFQSVALLLRERSKALNCMPIPTGVEQLVMHAGINGETFVEARLREQDDSQAIADLVLRDAAGRLIAEVRGLAFAWVDARAGFGVALAQAETAAFYQPAWIDAGPLPAHGIRAIESMLLIYPSYASKLADAIASRHASALRLDLRQAGATRQSGSHAWDIDVADANAFSTILQRLPSFDAVYFLGGMQLPDAPLDETAVAASQQQGLLCLFRLLKALLQAGCRQHPLVIKAITNGAQPVFADEAMQPLGAGIGGFMKSAAREYADWRFCHADIGAHDMAQAGNALHEIAQAIADETQDEIALRNARRFRRTLQPITLPQPPAMPFRQHGVYLILGGAGGIGLALAQHLAAHAKAKLVLLGRSPMTGVLRQKLGQIESLGGEALYLQADATVEADLAHAVQQAKTRFGALHGVVHSALVLQDQILDNMDEAALRAVLAPKVAGSVALYRAVAQEPLDFLLFFSSAQSFLGSAGQANYAAANAFQDAFAQALNRRAPYPVKLVNWGHWGEAGVAANAYHRERLAQQGFGSIATSEGMQAIRSALHAPASQLVFMKADARVQAAMGVQVTAAALPAMAAAPLIAVASLAGLPLDAASQAILDGLAQLAGEIFRIDMRRKFADADRLAATRLSDLGIDSLMAMELRNRVRAWTAVDVPAHLLISGGSFADVVQLIQQKLLIRQMSMPIGTTVTGGSPEAQADMEILVL